MDYPWTAIPEAAIPTAAHPLFQHLLDTYVSETNKVASTWKQFNDEDLAYKPHPRSSTVGDILKHQLLSERRFFGEFLGTPEPAPDKVLPGTFTVESATDRFIELAQARIGFFAAQQEGWWLETVPFFDVRRQRIWVFLAPRAPHRSPPYATHGLSTDARSRCSGNIRTNRRCHVERSRPHEFGCRCRAPLERIARIRIPDSSPFLSFPLALCSKCVKGKDAAPSAHFER